MDDLVGAFFWLFIVVAIIYAIIYVILFILLVALAVVPCIYMGWRLQQQLTRRYRVTLISAATLMLVGLGSLLVVFALVAEFDRSQQYYPWAYLLTIPIFLCLATATLGLWGFVKIYPMLAELRRTARASKKSTTQIQKVNRRIYRLNQKLDRLQIQHGSLLKQRQQAESQVWKLCTEVGDNRFRIAQKERLEREIAQSSDSQLQARLTRLQSSATTLAPESEIEGWLLEIALIDRQSGDAYSKWHSQQQELARLEGTKDQLSQTQARLAHQVKEARSALDAVRAGRIALN
ncbi:MAG: hypothetical protein BZ151_08885 [Desulfobacca sp. 4484_104]|nr:MAG: hypothetical protein BZ151_08885 [Desulfobacca sp. 4484_104]